MDARQFDTIVKELARIHVSRLAALRGLAAVALAGVTTASFTDLDSTAKRRNKHKWKQHRKDKRKTRQTTRQAFGRIGKPCNKDKPCGMYTECQFGRCSPTKCRIDGNLIDSGIRNDDNRCEYCSPNLAGDLWQQWKTFPDGTACPTDREDNPCLSTFIATCRGGECIPDRLGD